MISAFRWGFGLAQASGKQDGVRSSRVRARTGQELPDDTRRHPRGDVYEGLHIQFCPQIHVNCDSKARRRLQTVHQRGLWNYSKEVWGVIKKVCTLYLFFFSRSGRAFVSYFRRCYRKEGLLQKISPTSSTGHKQVTYGVSLLRAGYFVILSCRLM